MRRIIKPCDDYFGFYLSDLLLLSELLRVGETAGLVLSQAKCPFCQTTNSVKAQKGTL